MFIRICTQPRVPKDRSPLNKIDIGQKMNPLSFHQFNFAYQSFFISLQVSFKDIKTGKRRHYFIMSNISTVFEITS